MRSINGIPSVYVMAAGGTLANTTNGRIRVRDVIRSIPQFKTIAKVEVDELVRVNSNSGDTRNPQKARILLMLSLTRSRKPAVIQTIFREY